MSPSDSAQQNERIFLFPLHESLDFPALEMKGGRHFRNAPDCFFNFLSCALLKTSELLSGY